MSKPIVSLTYDGTLPGHLEVVVPQLQTFGLLGTFYADPASLLDDYPAWNRAALSGHEIGNGALIGAALPDGSLPAWTEEMICDDLSEADDLIEELFPEQASHSIGLPWGKALCGNDQSYLRAIAGSHPVIRTGEPGLNKPNQTNLRALRMVPMEDLEADQMIEAVRIGIQHQAWVILAFEGVGEGHRAIDSECHRRLLGFLKMSSDLVEVAPVIHAASRFGQGQWSEASVR